ncbi:MAG: emp24/gp25L/p24 family protein [archaeon]|nr:emp24/gp25L/p24 family protein [archaeon]
MVIVGFVGAFYLALPRTSIETISPGDVLFVTFNSLPGDSVTITLSITGGAGNDLDVWVTNPSGQTVMNLGRVSGGTTFSFTAGQLGPYTIHLSNSFSIISSKAVTISISRIIWFLVIIGIIGLIGLFFLYYRIRIIVVKAPQST